MKRWFVTLTAVLAAGLVLFGVYKWDCARKAAFDDWVSEANLTILRVDKTITELRDREFDFASASSYDREEAENAAFHAKLAIGQLKFWIRRCEIERDTAPKKIGPAGLEFAAERGRKALAASKFAPQS